MGEARGKTTATPPRLLTIAGSDSGGGAGIQADLKTFAAHGAYGMSAITAVTAQNTLEMRAIHEIPAAVVGEQIDAVFEDIGVDAIKIGMLSSESMIRVVAERLGVWREGTGAVPVVLDPVMIAKSGDALLADGAVEALAEDLLPLATVVTPNLPEAARLTGLPIATEAERVAAARILAARGPAVLIKGGHAPGEPGSILVDLLVDPRSPEEEVRRFSHPRLDTRSDHGTGCTLSAAIAARLGAGDPLSRAVEGAIRYLIGAMAAAYPLGKDPARGHGPVDHLYALRSMLKTVK